MNIEDLMGRLKSRGLKVTAQRIAVLEALVDNDTHPNADMIIKEVKRKNPVISVGTIYKILETFVDRGIISKLQTEDNIMRYDPLVSDHHHIYMKGKEEVVDFFDDNLTAIVRDYLKEKKELSDIDIESIRINIIGNRIK